MSLLAESLSKGILKFERGTNLGIAFERETAKEQQLLTLYRGSYSSKCHTLLENQVTMITVIPHSYKMSDSETGHELWRFWAI